MPVTVFLFKKVVEVSDAMFCAMKLSYMVNYYNANINTGINNKSMLITDHIWRSSLSLI